MRVVLGEPFALIVGAVSGAALWSLGSGVAPAAIVGGAIGLAGSGAALLAGRRPRLAGARTRVRAGSIEWAYRERAHRAVRAMQQLSASLGDGPMGARTRPFGEDAAAALGALDRLGARAAALGATLRGLDDRRLLAERRRLVGQMGATPEGPVHAELRRSAAALDDQLAVRRRLQDARTATLARLQSGTLDLERLAARLAEVVSLTAAGGERGPGQLDGVAEELEWLRRGLLEVGAADAEAATPAALSSTMSEQDAKLIDERPAAIGQPGGP